MYPSAAADLDADGGGAALDRSKWRVRLCSLITAVAATTTITGVVTIDDNVQDLNPGIF